MLTFHFNLNFIEQTVIMKIIKWIHFGATYLFNVARTGRGFVARTFTFPKTLDIGG